MNSQPVGAGFLAASRLVVTCAHVVNAAIQNATSDQIKIDFPLLNPVPPILTARIIRIDKETDIAGLEILEDVPSAAQPAHLTLVDELWGHTFGAFGFPDNYSDGVWSRGEVCGRNARGWIQIESLRETGYFVRPGFSGGPVWDEQLNGVVGMVVAADTNPGIRAAFLIPVSRLVITIPELIPCVSTGSHLVGAEASKDFIVERDVLELLYKARGTKEYLSYETLVKQLNLPRRTVTHIMDNLVASKAVDAIRKRSHGALLEYYYSITDRGVEKLDQMKV